MPRDCVRGSFIPKYLVKYAVTDNYFVFKKYPLKIPKKLFSVKLVGLCVFLEFKLPLGRNKAVFTGSVFRSCCVSYWATERRMINTSGRRTRPTFRSCLGSWNVIRKSMDVYRMLLANHIMIDKHFRANRKHSKTGNFFDILETDRVKNFIDANHGSLGIPDG